jgi:hypothetical protein
VGKVKYAAIEGQGAVQVGHLQVDMPDPDAWVDRPIHGFPRFRVQDRRLIERVPARDTPISLSDPTLHDEGSDRDRPATPGSPGRRRDARSHSGG